MIIIKAYTLWTPVCWLVDRTCVTYVTSANRHTPTLPFSFRAKTKARLNCRSTEKIIRSDNDPPENCTDTRTPRFMQTNLDGTWTTEPDMAFTQARSLGTDFKTKYTQLIRPPPPLPSNGMDRSRRVHSSVYKPQTHRKKKENIGATFD
ncbi:unnamed protein product [Ectocarpus sp. 8 AP-2014]